MWSDKYSPTSVSEMVGNEESRATVVEWLAKWKPGTKPVLMVGPPGTGKTTTAFLLARQFDYDLIGLNASDTRNKSKIREMLAPVLANTGVTDRKVMIFVDEVDGIHGRSDYGGSAALVDILNNPAVPIILAANDDTADKMKPIKKVVTTVAFKRVPPRLLLVYLEGVLRAESEGGSARGLGPGALIKTVDKSRGDIRSMLNMAQSMSTGFNPQTEAPVDGLSTEQAVSQFFKAKSAKEAADILWRMQTDPRSKIGAFYSSVITSNLGPRDAAFCMSVLSEADIIYGRIMRTQNWRLLRYLNSVLVRMYSSGSNTKYAQYSVSWPQLSRIRFDGAKIKALAATMAPALHVSTSAFGAMYMPYMLRCIESGSLTVADDGADHADIVEKEIGRLKRR